MGNNYSGQLLCNVEKGVLVVTWQNMGKEEIQDCLSCLQEWFTRQRQNHFFRTGQGSGKQVVVRNLDTRDPADEDDFTLYLPDFRNEGK